MNNTKSIDINLKEIEKDSTWSFKTVLVIFLLPDTLIILGVIYLPDHVATFITWAILLLTVSAPVLIKLFFNKKEQLKE